jgi:hypothetical protein
MVGCISTRYQMRRSSFKPRYQSLITGDYNFQRYYTGLRTLWVATMEIR